MKATTLFLGFVLSTTALLGQNSAQKYSDLIRKADSLYRVKEYKSSALAFSDAFKANGWSATENEHYNAACSWALAGYSDSAFFHLSYLATVKSYNNYGQIKGDPDLKSLISDKRWEPLLATVKANKAKAYANLDLMTVNGFKVEVSTAGMENAQSGKPVVVFENGLASTYNSWKTVIDEISKTAATFSYNRPRIGESEDDSLPPTTKHIVDNLRIMLLEKGFKPPYLLVSHSFGGAYIRSFASYYPNEIAGLIFVDPIDFTQKEGDGDLPYLELGLTQHQIDSMFAKPYDNFIEKLYSEMPHFYVEVVKISRALYRSEFAECDRILLPNIPVQFIMAGGYPTTPDDRGATSFDKVKLFRIDNNLKMKRWIALINPLKYGRFVYCSNSGHSIQKDDPDAVISSIKMALRDCEKMQQEKASKP